MKLPVTVDPEIMSGRPVFSGTRVPVDTLIGYLLDGNTIDEFLNFWKIFLPCGARMQ